MSGFIGINIDERKAPPLVKRIGWLPFLLVFLVSQTFGAGKANPSEGEGLFRHYCAVCHGETGKGDGVNSENLDPLPRDLTDQEYMSERTDQELFDIIEGGGPAMARSVYMPPWGKTLSKQRIQSLVTYIRTLAGGTPGAEPNQKLSAGKSPMGEKLDCSVCHVKDRKYRPIAPNLAYVGSKLNRSWLFNFLKSPDRIRPVGFIPLTKSTMPNFQMSDKEAQAVTEYLITLKDSGVTPKVLAMLDLSPQEVLKGRRLFVDRYGCIACHMGEGEGGINAPDLADAAERLRPEWIFRWIQNPQAIEPGSPMPNFGLPENRIAPLVAYILILSLNGKDSPTLLAPPSGMADPSLSAEGEEIIKSKNCFFCHKTEPINSAVRRGAQ